MKYFSAIICSLVFISVSAQDYFLENYGPFDQTVPTPEAFLGYPIGDLHTRHDRIVSYFELLAELSDKATLADYGMTYGKRRLIMLTVTSEDNLNNLSTIQTNHLQYIDPTNDRSELPDVPVIVNLGYNVHGNEPSCAEAALLTAYILIASNHSEIQTYRDQAVFFIDPVINPDGRDRHTHWANMHKGSPMVSDPLDIEHNEGWPRGRTNHYWFDLNRDWWLAIHPESRGKLDWYHLWYPNVVTDFHEMGTNSSHFFEPMKTNGSRDPVMPIENYTTLNDTFARYFVEGLDAIGSLYFTKEVFDGTYPGYGSSYPDLQGGLGLLFEQASSRGHVQDTDLGKMTFAYTIRNQLTSAMATVKASVEQKTLLYNYQYDFFSSALANAEADPIKAYVFGDPTDRSRTQAFLDKLLIHRVEVFALDEEVSVDGTSFKAGEAYVVPTDQLQYRIIQNAFETYDEYADSVFYDASAWSLVHFYNMPFGGIRANINKGDQIRSVQDLDLPDLTWEESSYAYLIPWEDYRSPALLNKLLEADIRVMSAFKPFTAKVAGQPHSFGYGTLMIPVAKQDKTADELDAALKELMESFQIPIYAVHTGYSLKGIDLGSRYFNLIEKPKVLLLVGEGVSSYEAGEVWHLLDQRVAMPITKVDLRSFNRIDWTKYSTLVMVSGSYTQLDSTDRQKIADWVGKGNTLITTRQASSWAIRHKMVKHKLIEEEKDKEEKTVERGAYVKAREEMGRESVGGAIFSVDLDLTHPLAFGYQRSVLPVYRNSTVWLAPSENRYCTVAKYTEDPHVDGFITQKNLDTFLKPGASLVVVPMGSGRAVMFAENPNFRGSWYGTNRLFLNAIFLGNHIEIPRRRN